MYGLWGFSTCNIVGLFVLLRVESAKLVSTPHQCYTVSNLLRIGGSVLMTCRVVSTSATTA